MDYVVTPFSNEAGTGGVGGDCKNFCAAKVTVCNNYNACGTNNTCFIRF
ncbi:hypothetical protein M3637_16090 [Paenibacillus illinoisensis]|nr:hypothetical protein [Paenibacillus illinoisensis]